MLNSSIKFSYSLLEDL